jgi:CheY-like chemotaxis protein
VGAGARPTALVADDLPALRDLLAASLEVAFDVITASDGEEALRQARAHRPALMVMDVDMPRLDGLAACRRLKADPALRHIPAALVTGGDREPARSGWRSAGAVGYITKPFQPAALLAKAGQWAADGTRQAPGVDATGPQERP